MQEKQEIYKSNFWWPTIRNLVELMHNNQITKFQLTGDNILRANTIFGPSIEIMKGRTTKNQPQTLRKIKELHVPNDLILRKQQDKLDLNHFFVNSHCFIHTKSRSIKYFTVDLVTQKIWLIQKKILNKTLKLYTNSGFAIIDYHCHNAFINLQNYPGKANMDIVGRGEHVLTEECSIRTIKKGVEA